MSIDFQIYMNTVSRKLCGPVNERMSKPEELRFGTNGSMCIDLKAGTFYDHDNATGGGVLDLIKHKTGKKSGEAITWLKVECGITEGSVMPVPKLKKEHICDYPYHDKNGNIVLAVERYKVIGALPGKDKEFKQKRPDGKGGWIWNLQGVAQFPYRLPDFIECDSVVIVEGEKDVDRLWDIGISATTNSGGAGNWSEELNQYFKDKNVFIIPDNDDPGRKHAELVAGNLKDTVASIRICRICSEMPEKADISDWLDAEK